MQASISPAGPDTAGMPAAPEDELHRAFVRLFRRLKRMSTMGGLDPALAAVLHELGCTGPVRVSVLADAMRLDQSTVSRHVSALEQVGLVQRSDDPDDRRAALLSLTPSGRGRLATLLDERHALFRAATAEWSDDDRAQLAGLLDRMVRALDSVDSPTISHHEMLESS
ncbi:MAG TPA: MarR family transcriptional regulator [Jiangellaceae bacterium]|nr:MarR family transcriptional regulator [Jiangellaceae bacterium]